MDTGSCWTAVWSRERERRQEALIDNETAWENFDKLADSYRKNYIRWMKRAKKEEIRKKGSKKLTAVRAVPAQVLVAAKPGGTCKCNEDKMEGYGKHYICCTYGSKDAYNGKGRCIYRCCHSDPGCA